MTEHGSSASHPSGPENRLGRETSPYLLQHKHNPVAWWAWSPDALTEAQRTGKPILLSVGYAACHSCHVMAVAEHDIVVGMDFARLKPWHPMIDASW